MKGSNPDGFSLLEVMAAAGIGMILSATIIPNMVNGISTMQMRSNMTSLAGVVQNCRMLAVRNNRVMSTHFSATPTGVLAYVKSASDNSSVAKSDSQVELEAPVSQVISPSGAGAPTAMDSSTLGFTPQTGDPSFNTSGLPCVYSSGSICSNFGFVYYFHDSRPAPQTGWAALTISPAGRLKKWYWNGAWTD